MNNKTIIEFGFRIIWRIIEVSEGGIFLDLHNSSDDTQPHSIIVKSQGRGAYKLFSPRCGAYSSK